MSRLRKQESRTNRNYWTPAFARVTDRELLGVLLILARDLGYIETSDLMSPAKKWVYSVRRLSHGFFLTG